MEHTRKSFAVCLAAAALIMTSSANYSLDLQGHRGARGLMPENTLPAFAHALSLGVTTLELDCAITRDGVVVVSHDSMLNPDITRGPDGAWLEKEGPPIWHLTYEELGRYDVGRIKPGSVYAARFPKQQALDGTRIPRLVDLFALVRKVRNETVRFNIETKISPHSPAGTTTPGDFAHRLIAVVRQEGMAQRVTIQSFDWRTLQVVQQDAPEIPTVYLSAQQRSMDNILANQPESPWTAGLHIRNFDGSIPRMVKAAGGAVWSPYYGEVTPANVKEAQSLTLKVVAWTVNSATDMRRMIELGVDGIISDYPGLLRKVAAEKGVTLPPATPLVHERPH